MKTTVQRGSVVAPIGDGEDGLGRILRNSSARFRVLSDVYSNNGEPTVDVVAIRGGGIYASRCRASLPVSDLRVTNDIASRPVAARKPTVAVHVADDFTFNASHAAYLKSLSRA